MIGDEEGVEEGVEEEPSVTNWVKIGTDPDFGVVRRKKGIVMLE